ncbi:MAG: multidrug transporter [Chloroflexales bacterium]|nr:multidrug transporter [Chloroflexales bacterium]
MKRITICDRTPIPPFDEPARDLRILNKPLWLMQHDLLKRYCKSTHEVKSLADVEKLPLSSDEELFVYKDNLYFNAELLDEFVAKARATKHACQIAFEAEDVDSSKKGDASIVAHAIHLQSGIQRRGNAYVADMYYFPAGQREEPQPLVIDTQAGEMGYYNIPGYMGDKSNNLTYQIPIRAFLSIENWVHILLANVPMGVFSWGRVQDELMNKARLRDFRHWVKEDWSALWAKLRLSLTAFGERINPFEERWRNHFLACKQLVKVGKNCSIDPTAIIHGPTVIGDNVYIGPGTVIANSLIGNNVNIMQGSQIMLSVVSDRCFLPFNAGLFMTTLMENTMVAQNSTLQLCVVGRNTFIGANNCFTDFNLRGEPIRTLHNGKLEQVRLPVLGSAVGHSCKMGSGFIVYPGRMIGSNSVIIFDHDDTLIRKNVPVTSHEVDELTGEPRRTVYYWPRVYDPAQHDTPSASDESESNGAVAPDAFRLASVKSPTNHASVTLGG